MSPPPSSSLHFSSTFYITSFILTSLQPGYSPLLPSLSHPISLLSHLSISLYRAPSPSLFTDARSLFVIHFPPSTLFHPDTIEAGGLLLTRKGGFCTLLLHLLPQAEVEHVEEVVVEGEYTRTILFRYRIPTSTFYRLSFFVTSRTLWSGAG